MAVPPVAARAAATPPCSCPVRAPGARRRAIKTLVVVMVMRIPPSSVICGLPLPPGGVPGVSAADRAASSGGGSGGSVEPSIDHLLGHLLQPLAGEQQGLVLR